MAATDSMPVPKKGVAFRLYFTPRNASNERIATLTNPDSEVALDGGNHSDCTNEAVLTTKGRCYIDLTTSEMNADGIGYSLICDEIPEGFEVEIAPEEAGDIRSRADLDTIKTQSVTCGAGVTVLASVGTAATSTAQTGDNYARLGAPAGASVSADLAAVKTDTGNLITRIPSALFAGITSLAQWLGLIAGKQAGNSTAKTELQATGAGSGTYDETTDSLQAVRDRGDAAWVTATGFAVPGSEMALADGAITAAKIAAAAITSAKFGIGSLASPTGFLELSMLDARKDTKNYKVEKISTAPLTIRETWYEDDGTTLICTRTTIDNGVSAIAGGVS
jgi:hypothetical protein